MKVFLFCVLLAGAASGASVSIDVLDATVKDKRVSGASVILQQTGETSLLATTDANGKATITSPKTLKSDALIIIKKEGFSDLVAKCPCDGLTYALSPVMKSLDGMRIVLSWGAAPKDLDSRLIYKAVNGVEQHIYYDNRNGVGADLDVDDIDSFGPETITITKLQSSQSYIYAVTDYSNFDKPKSRALSNSGAKVFVYTGQSLVKTYNVPLNQAGNIWTVFRVDPNGQITDLNAINGFKYFDSQRNKLVSMIRQFADSAALSRTINDSVNPAAIEQNRLGENAYHSGNIEGSIGFYQNAVAYDPNFAQAYSNMGLSYLKLNRFSESIWANRNAISLASGEGANIVRASSYYNIARLYEQDKIFAEALRYYELAKSENDNPTYDKAIARVKAKR
ncbi:MAG: tetratricopeptide repeat protein [Helicobacteraceae bacterium]|jgi:hypothetical protein|nr:tetratricopeptide repeat protein [Helicobacteraceae bacterium]